tara:strand:+ start:57 stop:842 length:786 start_codon:yes stop_codon:yes gene_type:complete
MPLPYHAGKARLAKPITSIIMNEFDKNKSLKHYAEPFCGMTRVGIELMKQDYSNDRVSSFYFSDINKNVIAFFKGFKRGWLPKPVPITQEEWVTYKKSNRASAQKSFYGYALGFSGQFMTGSKPNPNHNKEKYMKTKRELFKTLIPFFKRKKTTVELKDVNTLDFDNSVIYCDPPYFGSAWRSRAGGWGNDREKKFWTTVKKWLEPSKNNIILVSNGVKPTLHGDLKVEIVFEKEMPSPGNWRNSGEEKKRKEYVFKITLS